MGHNKCAYPKLLGRIVEVCGTQAAFAVQLNRSSATVSAKMNGKVPWDTNEIESACVILDIPFGEAGLYFLQKKLPKGIN